MPVFIFSRLVLLPALFFLLLAGCGTLSSFKVDISKSEATRYAINPNLQMEVDALARPLIETGQTPGLVIGILLPNGETHFYCYGVADKTNQTPVNADTVFNIGSLSKGFLGVITSQLVEEGALAWDATLPDLMPPNVLLSEDAKQVTLQQLATHTSGMPRQPYDFKTFIYFVEYLFTGKSFYRHYDQEYIYNYLAGFKSPSRKEPVYSNIGYGVLGFIVETRAKKKLETLLAEKITDPLGMTRTGYNLDRAGEIQNRAHGYAGDQPKFIHRGEPVPDWEFTGIMKGSASMYSNARDLLKFAKAYMDEPANMKHALADTLKIRMPRPKEAPAVAWVADEHDKQQIYYQVGMVGGYTNFIGLDKKHNQAVVVLQNSFNWSSHIGYQLLVRLGSAQGIRQRTD